MLPRPTFKTSRRVSNRSASFIGCGCTLWRRAKLSNWRVREAARCDAVSMDCSALIDLVKTSPGPVEVLCAEISSDGATALSLADEDFEAAPPERENPFALLQRLKTRKAE